ncbi:ATP-dependent nuclease [Methylobacterium sp. P31]
MQFSLSPVTVFVGPNNSGKSRVLTEIDNYCSSGQQANSLVISSMAFKSLPENEANELIERLRVPLSSRDVIPAGQIIIGSRRGRTQVHEAQLRQFIKDVKLNVPAYAQWFLNHLVLKLDGQSRIGLINMQGAGDLQQPPHTSLQVLFRDNVKRSEVRRIVKEAFGSYFVIDPTNIGHFRIRLAAKPPIDEVEERGLHEAAVEYHSRAQLIDEASDGVKAFTGIIIEFIAGDPKILLIDEPEAFLHPALAFNLGLEMSRASLTSDKRIFVSTHSPAFVMGCIQSGAPVNIVRLTYRNSSATARLLPSDELLTLMRNPLLRSTGVISGLFYEFVVITEADADRAFYQEINERLLRLRPEWGIPNCLFLHAQNKQTVQTIMRPLRNLGIPAAAIVDIDVLKEGGLNWSSLLSASGIPPLSHGAMASHRAAVVQAFTYAGKDMKRDGGVEALEGSEKEAALNLLQSLSEYGTFVVPHGELEAWLKDLGSTGHGPNWLINVFELMGEDPDSASYVRPRDNDVWAFIAGVRSWLTNASRKGIPA